MEDDAGGAGTAQWNFTIPAKLHLVGPPHTFLATLHILRATEQWHLIVCERELNLAYPLGSILIQNLCVSKGISIRLKISCITFLELPQAEVKSEVGLVPLAEFL